MKKLLLILFLYLGFTSNANADLLLFGGNSHDDFLGCYDCSKYDSDSICNKYGTYGSKYNYEINHHRIELQLLTYSMS